MKTDGGSVGTPRVEYSEDSLVMLMMRTVGALPRDDGYGIELYTGTHNRADSFDQFYRKLGESTRMKRNGRPVMT